MISPRPPGKLELAPPPLGRDHRYSRRTAESWSGPGLPSGTDESEPATAGPGDAGESLLSASSSFPSLSASTTVVSPSSDAPVGRPASAGKLSIDLGRNRRSSGLASTGILQYKLGAESHSSSLSSELSQESLTSSSYQPRPVLRGMTQAPAPTAAAVALSTSNSSEGTLTSSSPNPSSVPSSFRDAASLLSAGATSGISGGGQQQQQQQQRRWQQQQHQQAVSAVTDKLAAMLLSPSSPQCDSGGNETAESSMFADADSSITSVLSHFRRADADLHDLIQQGQPIGCGVSGYVTRVVHKDTGHWYALKYIPFWETTIPEIEAELQAFQRIDSKYVPVFYNAYYDDGYVLLLLELCDYGSLFDVVVFPNRTMPESVLACVARQILLGLQYLHEEAHYMHRDIKPQNLLVHSDGSIKITDFGISTPMKGGRSPSEAGDSLHHYGFVGTQAYMSPERLVNKSYGPNADVWGLGVTLYELAVGRHPFADYVTQMDLTCAVVDEHLTPHLPVQQDSGFSPLFAEFIELCTKSNPLERATASQLLEHEWVRFASDQHVIVDYLAACGDLWRPSRSRS